VTFKVFFGNPPLAPPAFITGVVAANEAADGVAISGFVSAFGTLATSEAPDTASLTGEVRPSFLNPNDKSANITLSNGNLTATRGAGSAYAMVRSTDSYASGKRYFEGRPDIFFTAGNVGVIGLATSLSSLSMYLGGNSGAAWSAGYFTNGQVWQNNEGTAVETGTLISPAEWAGLAVDFSAGKGWVRDNSGWIGDPVAGTGNSIVFTPGLRLHAATQVYSASDQTTVNFGATAFAYAVPAGFARWTPEEAPAAITGTLAATETADAFAATGTVFSVVTGTLGAVEVADTFAATGTVLVSGTLAAAETADDATLTGTVAWPVLTATLAATETPDDATFSGGTGIDLAGGFAPAVSLAGGVGVLRALDGNISPVLVFDANLTVVPALGLSGDIAPSINLAANLTTIKTMVGGIAPTVAIAADLTVIETLAGDLATSISFAGDLSQVKDLDGDLAISLSFAADSVLVDTDLAGDMATLVTLKATTLSLPSKMTTASAALMIGV
jgi:hypothetical protein